MTGEMRVYGSGRWRGSDPDHGYQKAVDEVEAAAERTRAERDALEAELRTDHDAEYERYRELYINGDENALDRMLEHVRTP